VHLDASTILLQWAAGGLALLWVTSRGRLVSLGYGWLLRSVYGLMGIGAFAAELRSGHDGTGHGVFLAGTAAMVLAAAFALAVSVVRRGAGVRAAAELAARRAARVATMTGDGPDADPGVPAPADGPEFPPALDLVAPVFGAVALLGAAAMTGGSDALAAVRLLVGAAFLGAVTDAMLLGHWYLTQPGLPRDPLRQLVRIAAIVWPLEVVVLLLPPGMVGVVTGSHDDGYGGLLGWMWVVCAITTGVLIGVTWAALRERYYSAVMAATGLLYLAILTAFGTDLVARAVLAP
jgi:hypothetical protein